MIEGGFISILKLPYISDTLPPSHDLGSGALGRAEAPDDKCTFYKLLTIVKPDCQLCYYAYIYFDTLSSQNSQSYIRSDPEDVCFTL